MNWIKLDDQFFSHPKVVDLSKDAKLLYLASLCYCGAQLTDGHLTRGGVRIIGAMVEASVESTAQELIQAGLWGATDDGWQIHDYLEYQSSREKALEVRAVRAEAGARGGKQSGLVRQAKREAKREANTEANTEAKSKQIQIQIQNTDTEYVRTPLPPAADPGPINAATAASHAVDNFTPVFDTFWTTYPGRPDPTHRPQGREPTRKALRGVPARDWDAVLVGAGHYLSSRDAQRGYAIDPARWLRERRWTEWQTPELPTSKEPTAHGETRHDLARRGPARTRTERDAERLAGIAAFLATPESDYGDADDGLVGSPAAVAGGGRILSYRPSLGPEPGAHTG